MAKVGSKSKAQKEFVVKVNFNELPYLKENKEMRKTCLGELEKLASEAEGMVVIRDDLLTYGNFHQIVVFQNQNYAFGYAQKLFEKLYVGRVTIERCEPKIHNALETPLPID